MAFPTGIYACSPDPGATGTDSVTFSASDSASIHSWRFAYYGTTEWLSLHRSATGAQPAKALKAEEAVNGKWLDLFTLLTISREQVLSRKPYSSPDSRGCQ